ncbi:MAG: hypothetical protein ACXVCS_20920 [Bdellovibrionota bacterium]
MKSAINAEIQKIKAMESSAELFLVFFRLVQFISCLGTVYFFFIVFPFLASPHYWDEASVPIGYAWFGISVGFGVARIILAELALRAVVRRQFWGTIVGLILAALFFSPWSFALSAFGFYCFLNPDFQRQYLGGSPEIFRNVLSTLGLNKIDTASCE